MSIDYIIELIYIKMRNRDSSDSSSYSSSSSNDSDSESRNRSRSNEKKVTKQEIFKKFHQKGKEKAIMIKSRFGYSNADNPFGDTNLDKQFVWKEKMKQ